MLPVKWTVIQLQFSVIDCLTGMYSKLEIITTSVIRLQVSISEMMRGINIRILERFYYKVLSIFACLETIIKYSFSFWIFIPFSHCSFSSLSLKAMCMCIWMADQTMSNYCFSLIRLKSRIFILIALSKPCFVKTFQNNTTNN